MISTTTRLRASASLSVLAMLFFAGCASTGSQPDDSGGGSEAPGASYEQDHSQWQSKFDACLRDEGIDVTSQDGALPSINDYPAEVFEAAVATCADRVGDAPVNPDVPSTAEFNEQQLKFAQCMRDAGYDWKDPEPVKEGSASIPGVEPVDPNEFDPVDMERCAQEVGIAKIGE